MTEISREAYKTGSALSWVPAVKVTPDKMKRIKKRENWKLSFIKSSLGLRLLITRSGRAGQRQTLLYSEYWFTAEHAEGEQHTKQSRSKADEPPRIVDYRVTKRNESVSIYSLMSRTQEITSPKSQTVQSLENQLNLSRGCYRAERDPNHFNILALRYLPRYLPCYLPGFNTQEDRSR